MSANDVPVMPELGSTRRDKVVALTAGAIGSLPGVGSILAAVISVTIPQQRQQRLEEYVRMLDARLRSVSGEEAKRRLDNPETVDLFEEGAWQSARALSQDRREYIASVVTRGITGDEMNRTEAKRLLNILREVDDSQIIFLAAHLRKYSHDPDFRARHAAVLDPVNAHMGVDPAVFEAEAVQRAGDAQLVRLELLRPRFKKAPKGQLPDFNFKTGLIQSQGTELTTLGRMLLREIGIARPEDI